MNPFDIPTPRTDAVTRHCLVSEMSFPDSGICPPTKVKAIVDAVEMAKLEQELQQAKEAREKVLQTAASFEHWGKERLQLQTELQQAKEEEKRAYRFEKLAREELSDVRSVNDRLNAELLKEKEQVALIENLRKLGNEVSKGVWKTHEQQFADLQSQLQQAREESEGRRKLLSELETYHFELEQKLDCMESVEDKKILQSIVSLQSQLTQAKEEIADAHKALASVTTQMFYAQSQLSQWQECARELHTASNTIWVSIMIRSQPYIDTEALRSELEALNKALSLFTQLTSTTTGEMKE